MKRMKRSILIGLGTLVAVMLGMGVLYAQTTAPGMMNQGESRGFGQGYGPMSKGGQYSPYDGAGQQDGWNGGTETRGGGWRAGPGMLDRFRGMFSGMMGQGRGMGSGQGMRSGMTGRGWGSGSGCR